MLGNLLLYLEILPNTFQYLPLPTDDISSNQFYFLKGRLVMVKYGLHPPTIAKV